MATMAPTCPRRAIDPGPCPLPEVTSQEKESSTLQSIAGMEPLMVTWPSFDQKVFVLSWGRHTWWNHSKLVTAQSYPYMIASAKFEHNWINVASTSFTNAPTKQ